MIPAETKKRLARFVSDSLGHGMVWADDKTPADAVEAFLSALKSEGYLLIYDAGEES